MKKQKKVAIKKSWCFFLGLILITTAIVFLPVVSAINLWTGPLNFTVTNVKTDSVVIAGPSIISEENKIPILPLPRGDPWTVTLNFIDTNGKTDYVVIAESSLASEGVDSYDVPKPGLPPQPYLYAWLNNSLPVPYAYLWKDYRHYSGIDKVWNLNVTCNTTNPHLDATTQITISWSSAEISNTRFTHVELWDDSSMVADMTTVTSYAFTATMNTVPFQYRYHFQIKGHVNQAPVVTDIPDQTIAEGSTFTTINLDDYVSDVDNLDSEMTWTYSGNTDLTVSIVARVATITIPDVNWYGAETITFTATDPDLASDSDAATFTVLQEHQITLNHGWNIISVPYYDSVAKTDIIVYYNSAPHTWSQAVTEGYVLDYLYDFNRATQSYGFSNSLEPGYGYWIWANKTGGCVLIVYSNEDGTGHITDLQVGWNIMGLPYRASMAKTSTHIQNATGTYDWNTAVSSHIILGFVYGWNSNSQVYELCDTFDPTRGYWMFSYQYCTLKE